MGLLTKLKGIFKKKQAEPVTPTVQPLPEAQPDPVRDRIMVAIAEVTAEIDGTRDLEVKAVTDNLRGKYRAKREGLELARDILAEAIS